MNRFGASSQAWHTNPLLADWNMPCFLHLLVGKTVLQTTFNYSWLYSRADAKGCVKEQKEMLILKGINKKAVWFRNNDPASPWEQSGTRQWLLGKLYYDHADTIYEYFLSIFFPFSLFLEIYSFLELNRFSMKNKCI